MHPALAFTDSLKRVWPCLVTSAEVFACQARLGVKLLDLLDPDSDESQRLSQVDKMEVLLLVLERPLAEQGVSTEGFLRSIPTAPYIAAAWEALHAGILSFCPALDPAAGSDFEGSQTDPGRRQAGQPGGRSASPRNVRRVGAPGHTFHDRVVDEIWHCAAWCRIDPAPYTLRQLYIEARHAARIAGQQANLQLFAGTGQRPGPVPAPSTDDRPLSQRVPRSELAKWFQN